MPTQYVHVQAEPDTLQHTLNSGDPITRRKLATQRSLSASAAKYYISAILLYYITITASTYVSAIHVCACRSYMCGSEPTNLAR